MASRHMISYVAFDILQFLTEGLVENLQLEVISPILKHTYAVASFLNSAAQKYLILRIPQQQFRDGSAITKSRRATLRLN